MRPGRARRGRRCRCCPRTASGATRARSARPRESVSRDSALACDPGALGAARSPATWKNFPRGATPVGGEGHVGRFPTSRRSPGSSPPHTPSRSPAATAYPAHGSRAAQGPHAAMAASVAGEPSCFRSGHHASGSVARQGIAESGNASSSRTRRRHGSRAAGDTTGRRAWFVGALTATSPLRHSRYSCGALAGCRIALPQQLSHPRLHLLRKSSSATRGDVRGDGDPC